MIAICQSRDTKMKSQTTKSRSMIKLFVEDFEVQNWELTPKAKESIYNKEYIFYLLYFIDFVICHILIGKTINLVDLVKSYDT